MGLCFQAVSKFSISKGDPLFQFGAECSEMLILMSGTLFYRRAKGVHEVMRFVTVEPNCSFCETVLWTPWVHRGTMKALIESDLVALSSQKFRDVTMSHPEVMWHAKKYAQ